MQNEDTIEHTGTVKSVENKHITVNILSHPACSGCIASGICDLSGRANKEIIASAGPEVKAGDQVIVVMKRSMGFKALFLGYLLPFIIVMLILIVLTSLSVSESVSGITALFSLVPYYVIIYLRKEKVGKSYSFTIKKLIK
ncbi:MAG: SoxR reducing system RseC family protein [Bacteroidales bacterium]|nr:SoxR reducing system RseC family protein [Bacteroidales bacterium]